MKFIFLFLTLAFIFFGCKTENSNDYQKEVYLGFKLGSSTNDIKNRINQLVSSGDLKLLKEGNVYYTNKISANYINNKTEYYSTPIFKYPPLDTTISQIKVVFFDNLDYASGDIARYFEGGTSINLKTLDIHRVPFNKIFTDVKSKLIEKYGNYTLHDTVEMPDRFAYSFLWENKSGVDIKLDWTIEKPHSPFDSPLSNGNSSLLLSFNYTKNLEDKIFQKKSIY